VLQIYKDSGMGVIMKNIEFRAIPLITDLGLEEFLQDFIESKWDERRLVEDSRALTQEIIQAVNIEMTTQKNFSDLINSRDGFETLIQILDCMPNLESLNFRCVNFWRGLYDRGFDFETLSWVNRRADARVVHWDCLPRMFEVVKRYSLKSLTLHADSHSSMFAELGSYPYTQCPTVIKSIFLDSCKTVTSLSLRMTPMDQMSLGRYSSSPDIPLSLTDAFRDFLSSIINLREFSIAYHRDFYHVDRSIIREWLETVLTGQSWPCLQSFNLDDVQINPVAMLKLLIAHKHTLKYVSLTDFGVPTPGSAVQFLNGMKDSLSLPDSEIHGIHFYDNYQEGILEFDQLCSLYGSYDSQSLEGSTPQVYEFNFGHYVCGKVTRSTSNSDLLSEADVRAMRVINVS